MTSNSISGRRKRWALLASAGLAASAVTALPAQASITGDGVRDGSNIMVMHNIDFVAVGGYGPNIGDPVTVEVFRQGVLLGSASGPAIDAEGASGLEVNHGPEGDPAPGDCFDNFTPDIEPGDVIHVTDADGTDEITVDDIRFTGQPFVAPNGDVLIEGIARRFDGTPIPPAQLDSAEFRDGSALRIFSDLIRIQRRTGPAGAFTMRYLSPFNTERNRDNLTPAQIRNRLLTVDGHAIGFGHVEPSPADAQMVEGLGDTPGPAPGCEAAPSAQWDTTRAFPSTINTRNRARGLTVRGLSHDASAVSVALTDNDPTTTGPAPRVAATLSQAAGSQTWVARFTPRQLRNLNRRIRVHTTFSIPDGDIRDRSQTVIKDLLRPNAPRASLRPGVYNNTKRVALRGGPNRIRYTLGNGRQPRPTARTGAVYRGRKIVISSSQVLKAVSIDRNGNVSRVARFRYRIR